MSRKRKKDVHFKQSIGIYCEGLSEKEYFEMLKRKYNASNVKAERINVDSLGESGKKLIIEAKRKGDYKKQRKVYVVFDKDDKSKEDIIECRQLAHQENVNIIFSNVCFEIWILMHFEPVMRSYSRDKLFDKLSGSNYFDQDYRRFKGKSYDKYLYDRINKAYENSVKLFSLHSDMINDDPYTNIHLRLKEIFKVEIL